MMSVMRLISDPNARFEGEVLYKGRDLMALNPDQMRAIRGTEIAMIFQDPMTSLNPVYRVGWQIAEQIRAHENVSKQAARARAIELLAAVGIPQPAERVDDYPHEFSGGMRQRVMIAMALSCNPDLLIADEPTTALDVTIQAQILDPAQEAQGRLRHRGRADHPRHGRGGRHGRPDRGDVRGADRRAGQPAGGLLRRPASVHLGPARLHRPAGPAQAEAPGRDSRAAALAAPAARGVRLRATAARTGSTCATSGRRCSHRVDGDHLDACHLEPKQKRERGRPTIHPELIGNAE